MANLISLMLNFGVVRTSLAHQWEVGFLMESAKNVIQYLQEHHFHQVNRTGLKLIFKEIKLYS